MTDIAVQVMATVNAPYGAHLSAHQLAAMIVDVDSVGECNAAVFAFFSEVSASLQEQFMQSMRVDQTKAALLATALSQLSGYTLPLAA
ncbi:hypothetical protein [Novosphingobium colocasiae]|uniref:hypothetical protein n=1 Tax=Novosphingobium colocasiae TaxID=1256513 RepID=UPI0035AF81F0